jgi:hypothetical protein
VKFEFNENNSGGSWWLKREQYDKLLANGWSLPEPSEPDNTPIGRSIKSLKKSLQKSSGDVPYEWRHGVWGEFASMQEAVESWERATGEDFFAEGCNCCGAPFSMSSDDDHLSGDSIDRAPVRPW